MRASKRNLQIEVIDVACLEAAQKFSAVQEPAVLRSASRRAPGGSDEPVGNTRPGEISCAPALSQQGLAC